MIVIARFMPAKEAVRVKVADGLLDGHGDDSPTGQTGRPGQFPTKACDPARCRRSVPFDEDALAMKCNKNPQGVRYALQKVSPVGHRKSAELDRGHND